MFCCRCFFIDTYITFQYLFNGNVLVFLFSEISAKTKMQIYIDSVAPIILYVDKLFTSRDLGIDW